MQNSRYADKLYGRGKLLESWLRRSQSEAETSRERDSIIYSQRAGVRPSVRPSTRAFARARLKRNRFLEIKDGGRWNLRNEWHLEEGTTERCGQIYEQRDSKFCFELPSSSGPCNARVYTRARIHTHTRVLQRGRRVREERSASDRSGLSGRYRPGSRALIETPTPSLCGYRKHSPHTRTRDLPYANIADLLLSPPPLLSPVPSTCRSVPHGSLHAIA